MDSIARKLRDIVHAAVSHAAEGDSVSIAAAVNVGGDGRRTSAWTDGRRIVVDRDGEQTVVDTAAADGEDPPAS